MTVKLEFTKMHGLGNDFAVIDDLSRETNLGAAQVAFLCDRRYGIGADGVILVRPSERPECAAYMHYVNADGTLAQMCGNGVRCFAKYLVDRGLVQGGDGYLVADTLAGPKPIRYEVGEDGLMARAAVDMGRPALAPHAVPVDAPSNAVSPDGEAYVCEWPVESPWGTFAFTCVSMGNPHAVCFVDDWATVPDSLFGNPSDKSLSTFDVNRIGSFYEPHPLFPGKTNVEFACAGSDGIAMRVYERGCGETLACGTGACAVGVAAMLTNRRGRENDVLLPGGALHVVWEEDGRVMMTGPAVEVFRGAIDI